MHVHVVDHPLAGVRLATLRNEITERPAFRRAVTELSRMIVYEALRDASTVEIDIDTPLEPARGVALLESPVVVPVMRAGLGMLDATLELLPDARVGFVGLKRNEETLLPDAYVNTVPDDLAARQVLVLDPMLATGGSIIHTCDLLRESNAGEMTVACLLAAPEGLEALHAKHPDIRVYTAVVDDSLNDVGFIRPGLGDAGDRQFGLD